MLNMISSRIIRFIHTNNLLWQSSNKSLLAKLRKKTGFTFANCKKALEVNSNDIQKAEAWLKEQAQQHGWIQAAKLQGRSTTQGLIAVIVEKNYGALVEINCETDFVARNKKFHGLAETVLSATLNHATTLNNNDEVERTLLDTETLKALPAKDGKTLADHSALIIGTIGENITLRRALCMRVQGEALVFGGTHPAPMNPIPISFGRYGALVAVKGKEDKMILGTQLCQHIIGMNPLKVGDNTVDQPIIDVDNETCLIYQEFLLDPSLSVQQVLKDAQVEVLDFARFELGEKLNGDKLLDSVEVCG
ncbi:elongation factor Ts, mitochondrial isoform X2 [Polistes fuscatus]|uniref:elongation factor Ts, mitochondrial isoform X2 n=1 Tax=Polistes fuscatus TaxID=30207 RepID=UPI001CAA3A3F|nr:elongation factor Ts, mitochondrial isoform X2 [Polistes fuscatus]